MESTYIEVSGLGPALLPGKFAEAWSENPIRCFLAEEGSRNQAMKFLKRGGTLVLTGAWQAIAVLQGEILKRESELLPPGIGGKDRELAIRGLHRRILTTAGSLPIESAGFTAAELPGFLGEGSLPDGTPTLLPVEEAERLLRIPENECFVRAVDASIIAHPDVLVPRSQETIEVVCAAIESCIPGLPETPRVLEVGCGSGVLCIAVWQILGGRSPSITATDILPEAVATARLNWRRLGALGKAGPEGALATRAGSLFDPVGGELFDLIIFNAPWVVAPARNRLEHALNDERQQTIGAFIEGAPEHLRPGGRVIVGYAENAGPKAIERLEGFFSAAGMAVEQLFKDRIHTRRAKRQWQSIYAYVLSLSPPRREG